MPRLWYDSKWDVDEEQEIFIQELKSLMQQYGPSFGEKVYNFLVNNETIPERYQKAFSASSLATRQTKFNTRVAAGLTEQGVRWMREHTNQATGQLRHTNPIVRFLSRHSAFLRRYFDNRLIKQTVKDISSNLRFNDPLVQAVKETVVAARAKTKTKNSAPRI